MGNQQSTPLSLCLKAAVPNLALPSKFDYPTADVRQYNLDVKVAPVAVTYPTVPEHVSAIVKCANDNGYKIQAKGGGHSYANFGR